MTSGKDILLINRDQAFLDYWVGVLQTSGYKIHTAMEMRGALAILSKQPVKLIICDKELQDVSGNDFLRFIKSDPLRENIPFMFLVPIKDQGRPFAAFELGAIDFLVYPIDPEKLIGRIDEAFAHASRKGTGLANKTAPAVANRQTPEKAEPLQEKTLPNLKIDISRDGVIWMPAIVKSFSSHILFMETSLFGKPGVRLMLRFKLANGMFVAHSQIKEISFDDFQKPAGLSIAVEQDDTWRRIHADLEKTASVTVDTQPGSRDPVADRSGDSQKTLVMPQAAADSQDISGSQLIRAAEKKKTSYDVRFYHSLIGKQLDNYRAISLIGSGTMGGVLQGWDVALEREVALKIISYALSSKQQFRDMFISEARLISRLNHTNIAQVYSIGNSNEILYYAMELINGETLKDIIIKQGKLDISTGLEYLITICEALDFVYRSSIVHRDIKPANIMITTSGIIKLVDFGVARVRDAKTSGFDKNMIIGTPLYMSPEQIAGLALDHRSDMYSLGATFYHAFCGSPPFVSDDFKKILDQHLNTPIISLKDRNAGIDPDMCRIIEKMLAKDPNDRFPDFQAIVDELKARRS